MTVVAYVVGVVVLALGVAASIALHEVGHLVPAKRFGVRVTQYMVGFGPTVWSRRRGETEYGLKAIPLGGYIRMIGMFPPRAGDDPTKMRVSSTGRFSQLADEARKASLEEIQPGDDKRVFYRLPVHRKVIVMNGGPGDDLSSPSCCSRNRHAHGIPTARPVPSSIRAPRRQARRERRPPELRRRPRHPSTRRDPARRRDPLDQRRTGRHPQTSGGWSASGEPADDSSSCATARSPHRHPDPQHAAGLRRRRQPILYAHDARVVDTATSHLHGGPFDLRGSAGHRRPHARAGAATTAVALVGSAAYCGVCRRLQRPGARHESPMSGVGVGRSPLDFGRQARPHAAVSGERPGSCQAQRPR